MAFDTRYGVPLPARGQSLDSVLILEPTLGLDVSHPAVGVPPGATPYSENFIIRDGALEPRPMLSPINTNAQPVTFVTGGMEVVDVVGNRYPLISGLTRPAWYSNGSWSVLSYVAAYGINAQPSTSNNQYWDMTQIYAVDRDDNIAIMATGSYQSLYCWQSNTTVFSTLTGAPKALYVTAFNDFLLAFNIQDPGSAGSRYVQRVQWNDRGSASSWTGGLSGFEDLLDMRGAGTRILGQANRVVVLSDEETWQGIPVAYPFIFRFEPLDRGVGCPYPWTAVNTSAGAMWLAKDYNVYLLSTGGGSPVAVGDKIQKYLRDNLDNPQRAFALYDHTYNQYQLYFPIKGGSGRPQRALFLHLSDPLGRAVPLWTRNVLGAWALQTFDPVGGTLSMTRGFEAQTSSSATTWGGLQAAGMRWADLAMTWGQLGGSSELRAPYLGSSGGTVYYLNSRATSDNGTPVRSLWRSSAFIGFEPDKQKTMGRIRVEYQADSASSLSIAASSNQGASFDPTIALSLPANSQMSETVTHFYTAARYPMFQLTSEGQRYRLFRFWLSVRAGGR